MGAAQLEERPTLLACYVQMASTRPCFLASSRTAIQRGYRDKTNNLLSHKNGPAISTEGKVTYIILQDFQGSKYAEHKQGQPTAHNEKILFKFIKAACRLITLALISHTVPIVLDSYPGSTSNQPRRPLVELPSGRPTKARSRPTSSTHSRALGIIVRAAVMS